MNDPLREVCPGCGRTMKHAGATGFWVEPSGGTLVYNICPGCANTAFESTAKRLALAERVELHLAAAVGGIQ